MHAILWAGIGRDAAGSHNHEINAQTYTSNKSINQSEQEMGLQPPLMSEQPKRCINHTLAGVEISMEVLRLGADVEPLPHEGLGP